jgi:hypothetical protein
MSTTIPAASGTNIELCFAVARLVAFASALQLVLVAHPTQGAETPTTMRCH